MNTQPNIIFIITDQQRADTVNSHGYPYMITPHLDGLTKDGIHFTQAHCPGATCISSRAALFTGMYAHNTGTYSFNEWNHHPSWVQDLADNGYHCVNLGKMHCAPHFADCGFHERRIVENKCSKFRQNHKPEDEWGFHLMKQGFERPNTRFVDDPDGHKKCNTLYWDMDESNHPDVFVGDMAINWINQWDGYKPLFLEIGFPGPHEPYDSPKRYVDMYEDKDIPKPVFRENELDGKPPQHKAFQKHFQNVTDEDSRNDLLNASIEDQIKMRKHYYANVTLIDDKVGEILDALEKKGILDNTIIVFTSDHGDNLGDHTLPYKWLMYDSITRVPFIIKDFRTSSKTPKVENVVSLMDIGPTCLDYAGVDVPSYLEGKSLQPVLDGQSYDFDKYVFCEDNYLIMMRSDTHKIVYYIDQPYGELYDLKKDPDELENLWDDEAYKEIKTAMKMDLLDWFTKSNYFNGGYKTNKPTGFMPRWPDNPAFKNKLHRNVMKGKNGEF
jgi:arylsulfatase A-like enzyme